MSEKDYGRYTDYENYTMLTDRELEVLKMKNSGMSNTEISESLGVKYNTVSIYLTRSTQKIDGVFDYSKEKMYKNTGAKRRKEDPEYRKKINAYAREYYHKNSEKALKRIREYQEKNQDKIKEYQKEYQREYQKEYYKKNQDKFREYQREYYQKNKDNKAHEGDYRYSRMPYEKANNNAELILIDIGKGKTVRQISEENGCSRSNIYMIIDNYRKRMEKVQSGSEIIGKKFGRLTVIKPDTSSSEGRSKWICQCECGNTTSVFRNHLTSGQTTSCGCARKGVNLKDITGEKFGRLTAIERTERKCGRAYIYKCQCDCGNICYVSGAHLRRGDTVSCGCYASDVRRESISAATNERKKSYVDGTDLLIISRKKLQSNNTSGYRGVSWDDSVKLWKAYITFKGKRYYLGSSTDINQAIELRKIAEKEIHGSFLEWYAENFPEQWKNIQKKNSSGE